MPKNVSVGNRCLPPRRLLIRNVRVSVPGTRTLNVVAGGDYRYMQKVDRQGGRVQVPLRLLLGLRPDVDPGSGLDTISHDLYM